jgi:hypothetical protein
VFTPGIDSVIYLPSNGSKVNYRATLRNNLSGFSALQDCYGKYDTQWSWFVFEDCDPFDTTKPSTWATVEKTGPYAKRWRFEQGQAIGLTQSVVECSSSRIFWTLSSDQGMFVSENNAPNITDFLYSLKLEGYGLRDYTTSKFFNTNVTINAQQSFACYISAFPYDWKVKTTNINESFNTLSIVPPDIKLYTPNRFVLTGTEIPFENLSTNLDLVCSIKVDFDNGSTITLTGSDITNSFSTTYDTVGSKTITVDAVVSYTNIPIQYKFSEIVRVLNEYDTVSPTEYRTADTPILLPWPELPCVGSNDWATSDNINSQLKKIYENLEYIQSRGKIYNNTFSEYFGYYGSIPSVTGQVSACTTWTWEDLDCLNTSLNYQVLWRDVLSSENIPLDNGDRLSCGTWLQHEKNIGVFNPNCTGLYNVDWKWKFIQKNNITQAITWKQTKKRNLFAKRWYYEPNASSTLSICEEGTWNVNIPFINDYYDPIADTFVQPRCIYNGVASQNNLLYLAQKNQILLLSADKEASLFSLNERIDGVVGFSDIKNICLDSTGKIFVLDSILSKVASYNYEPNTPGADWRLVSIWGGYGNVSSNLKFSNPNDIHVDQFDNVWVADTGNSCVKHYTNTGAWLKTIRDDVFFTDKPISMAVDSEYNIHILTSTQIRVYNDKGVFIKAYSFTDKVTSEPRKINTSYNREIVYIVFESQVLKFFRNGEFAGYIVNSRNDVNNITGLYQDEFRNVLITTNDKVLKYPDLMTIRPIIGDPTGYWPLKDILIHDEEYVQNWVYTRAFQRMWDNIELIKNSLQYTNVDCKQYIQSQYDKDKMVVGQNEIVTSATVNRVLEYLWKNFLTIIDFYKTECDI